MSNPVEVMDAIDADAERLDALEQLLETTTTTLDEAEAAWDEAYDKVAEAMRDEFADAGRKADPAEPRPPR
jgi:hemoglobin-like flavoprotein